MLSLKLKQICPQNPEYEEFEAVHLNYKNIKIIDNIPSRFAFIEQLYLNHNNLLSLSGIEVFKNLKIFHFRFNKIADFEQLMKINNGFFLKSLAVFGNPMETDGRCNEAWLHKNLFKNIEQYNPSCIDYYHNLDKKPDPFFNQSLTNSNYKSRKMETTLLKTDDTSNKNTWSDRRDRRPQEISFEETKRVTESLSNNSGSSRKQQAHKVKPFEEDLEQISMKTAKFTENKVENLNQTTHIARQFLDEQNEFLVQSYYHRNLLEKSMKALKGEAYVKSQRVRETKLLLKSMTGFKMECHIQRISKQYNARYNELMRGV